MAVLTNGRRLVGRVSPRVLRMWVNGDAHLSPCMRACRRCRTSWDAAPCPCALLGVLGLSEPGGVLGLVLFCRLFASCPLRGGDSERLVWGQCCQLRRRFLARLSVQETTCRWRRHRYTSTQRTAALALSTPESPVLDNSNRPHTPAAQ